MLSGRLFRNNLCSPQNTRAPTFFNKTSANTSAMSRRPARNTFRATHTQERFRYIARNNNKQMSQSTAAVKIKDPSAAKLMVITPKAVNKNPCFDPSQKLDENMFSSQEEDQTFSSQTTILHVINQKRPKTGTGKATEGQKARVSSIMKQS